MSSTNEGRWSNAEVDQALDRFCKDSGTLHKMTILNLVARLVKRHWLVRRDRRRPAHYLAALSREETAAALAGGFVEDFFGGSASNLVMSLLGSKRLKPDEIEQLRRVLESASKQPGAKKEG